MSYETWGLKKLPRFLRGAWGTLWSAVFSGIVQRTEDAVRETVDARFAATAPDDALPYLAHDAGVPYFIGYESLGVLSDRIVGTWDWHIGQGKEAGTMATLESLGFDTANTYIIDRSFGEMWFHVDGWWSTWAIVTRNPTGWTIPVPSGVSDGLYSYLWKYKWAHGVCAYVSIVEGDGWTWDLVQAEGYTWTTWEGLAVTWDDVEDVTTNTVAIGRLWACLDLHTGDQPTWDEVEADGLHWARWMTAEAATVSLK